MFVYQAAIILGIILLLGILIFTVHIRRRGLLAVAAVVLSVAGAGAMFAVQNVFGAHIYQQNIDLALVRRLAYAPGHLSDAGSVLAGYQKNEKEGLVSYSKTYRIRSGRVTSSIRATVSLYPTREEADRYFTMSQKVFENKKYVPVDTAQSQREDNDASQRYLVTYIKTEYSDENDLIYLPSKMSNYSYIIVQNGSTILTMSETARGRVCVKNTVFKKLAGLFGV